MCFHSKQTKLALEVENRFNAKIEKKELFQSQENINGFNFAKNPIITDENEYISVGDGFYLRFVDFLQDAYW